MGRVMTFGSTIRVEIGDDRIADVIFGPAGSMPFTDAQGHADLAGLWRQLGNDPEVRVILVRTEGKGFCAGGTAELVDTLLTNESARLRLMREARELVQGMIDCDVPIISAIRGAAVGAGAAVALLADISIASRSAKLVDGHTKLGVAAGDHAAVIWPLLCGMARAKFYLLTCSALSGEEAERIGLVSLAVADEDVDFRAREIAVQLAAGSPTALSFTKRSLNHWLRAAWPAFEHSLALEVLGFAGSDAKEGLSALKEKRAPRFSPR